MYFRSIHISRDVTRFLSLACDFTDKGRKGRHFLTRIKGERREEASASGQTSSVVSREMFFVCVHLPAV